MTWRVDGLHLIVNGCVDCMLVCEWVVWDCSDSQDSLKFVEWRGHMDSLTLVSHNLVQFLGIMCPWVSALVFKLT